MKPRTIALLAVWILPSLVLLVVTGAVYSAYRISPPDRLDDAERAALIAPLRAALEGKPAPALGAAMPVHGPVAVTVWSGGRTLIRLDSDQTDAMAAVQELAPKLREHAALQPVAAADRALMRIQIDVVTGTAPLGTNYWLFERLQVPGVGEMMAINPGVEGIGVTLHGKQTVVLPHELVTAKLLASKKPIAALQDFAMGIDLDKIRTLVAQRANASGGVTAGDLWRFRTDTFVEQPLPGRAQPSLQLYRGIPPPPPLTAKLLRELALDGGRYLIAHLAPTPTTAPNVSPGRYIYEHDLATGTMTDPRSPTYSMPRHAGTTYFLAELYRITKEPWLREPIERAFAHLVELMGNGKCTRKLPDGTDMDCVMDKTDKIATLGSTALAVVALAEYQRATGDPRYLPVATKLAAFILWMQRPDGSFRHRYDPVKKLPDDEAQDLYYSGEAALAMARMHVVTGDAKYARSAEGALDWLVGWYDDFLLGFLYGEEHWTCIASEALWPAVKKESYRDFCHGYGKYLRDQQAAVGDHPDQDDLAGAYGFTPFLMPHNTPAGSRTEAMISAYLLGRHHGTPDEAVRGQIRAALQYVLGQQIRPETDFAAMGASLGGMPGGPIDRNVRIDYVQHVCSAMIRASEWIDE